MNKQNFFISSKSNRAFSIEKAKKQERISLNQKNIQINKGALSPMKKRLSHNNNQSNLFVNKKKSSLRLDNKIPLKQLILLKEISQNDQIPFNNKYELSYLLQEIQQVIRNQIIPIAIEDDLAKKNHFNHIILKQQVFIGLLKIIFCTFVENKYLESTQKQNSLSQGFFKIKNIILAHNIKKKIQKNQIIKQDKQVKLQRHQSKDFERHLFILEQLKTEKAALVSQIQRLKQQKGKMDAFTEIKKNQIMDLSNQIVAKQNQINELLLQYNKTQNQVQKIKLTLSNCQRDFQKISNYVKMQTKNKHVIAANIDYKQIQAEIYDYAAFLSMNQIASDQYYQSIPMLNQCFLINGLQSSLKNINKKIIEDNQLTLHDKQKILRDFALKLTHQYKRKNEEYEKQIQFKTNCINNFTNKMKKWMNNWELKQQYLVNLRKAFALDQSQLKIKLHQVFCEKMCQSCYLAFGKQHDSILEIYQKIQENYKMGNSFY